MENETSQDKILYQLKRSGPQTAKSLATKLVMTTMGMRQHLGQLAEENLVETTAEVPAQEGGKARGRPVKRWKLTQAGHGRFPDAHAQVTSELIIAVRDVLGEDALGKVIASRTSDMQKSYQSSLDGVKTLRAKLKRLSELRSAEGYMAELEVLEDGFLLIENHCPICIAATSCQGFCESELEVFQALFQSMATVEREQHLLNGARRCSYRVRPLG